MPKRLLCTLLAASLLGALPLAHAENTLQGLEMDVMEPGESASQATARIALPRPAGIEGEAGYSGLDTERRIGRDAGAALDGMLGITGADGPASVDGEVGRVADPGTTEGPVGQPGD